MNFNSCRLCLAAIGLGAIALYIPLSVNATEDLQPAKQLVDPVEGNTRETIHVSKNVNNPNNRTRQREYVYKAPDRKVISNPQQLTKSQDYKVEVYGNSDRLLKDIKDIEPKAFRKGEIIQVGIFSRQDNAELLVRKLAAAGFWARIVTQ